ncbi:hypothetical protein DL770_007894 [Monosporascus sp. CRB-9-2]|nr:hypothetical protein DL770_007894 [Monosporascus sp. CRB-9-2]
MARGSFYQDWRLLFDAPEAGAMAFELKAVLSWQGRSCLGAVLLLRLQYNYVALLITRPSLLQEQSLGNRVIRQAPHTPPGVTPANVDGKAASSICESGASNRAEDSGQSAAFPPMRPDALNTFYWSSALLAAAQKARVKVFNKKQVVSYDFEGPSATTRDADIFKADLVIGADGINSIARLLLTGQPEVQRDTGDVAYRILISGEKLLADPELADLITDLCTMSWRGPDAHLVGYPTWNGGLYNIVVHPSGNAVLLGDSCHPMLPYLAQSFEDAATLRQGLALDLDLRDALKRYEEIRMPRAPVHCTSRTARSGGPGTSGCRPMPPKPHLPGL